MLANLIKTTKYTSLFKVFKADNMKYFCTVKLNNTQSQINALK